MSRRPFKDPFSSDPFFRDGFQQDPFERMNMMMNSMLGSDPFFGAPGFGGREAMHMVRAQPCAFCSALSLARSPPSLPIRLSVRVSLCPPASSSS